MTTSKNEKRPWAREHDACLRCKTTVRPHKSRGLCARCYHDANEAGELVGTWRHAEALQPEQEWNNDQEYQAELTAAWLLWLESPSIDPAGWGVNA